MCYLPISRYPTNPPNNIPLLLGKNYPPPHTKKAAVPVFLWSFTRPCCFKTLVRFLIHKTPMVLVLSTYAELLHKFLHALMTCVHTTSALTGCSANNNNKVKYYQIICTTSSTFKAIEPVCNFPRLKVWISHI